MDGSTGKTDQGSRDYTRIYSVFYPFRFVLLYLIRELLLLAGKWWRWFSWLPALGSITFAGVLAFITYSADILLYAKIPLYYLAMFTVEFISIKYLEQREDLNERYEEIKAREKKDKEHRKKANHFPGKYPPEFYEVIRQNFRYHWKEQIVFLISGILLAAICYIVFAIYFMTDRIYGGKGKTSFMFGQGIHGIFQSLALILGVLSVLMMVLMISWYIKEQKKGIPADGDSRNPKEYCIPHLSGRIFDQCAGGCGNRSSDWNDWGSCPAKRICKELSGTHRVTIRRQCFPGSDRFCSLCDVDDSGAWL